MSEHKVMREGDEFVVVDKTTSEQRRFENEDEVRDFLLDQNTGALKKKPAVNVSVDGVVDTSEIIPRGAYIIKSGSKYFENKYHRKNPMIEIECRAEDLFNEDGEDWRMKRGNPACELYFMRSECEGLTLENVWYGKVFTKGGIGLGELVNESELLL